MATSKQPESQPLPPQDQPQPGPLPTEGDEVREVGKRAHDDDISRKENTDQGGFDRQRAEAPDSSPVKRSGINDGSSG